MDITVDTMLSSALTHEMQAMHDGLTAGAILYALIEAGSCSPPGALAPWLERHGLDASSLFAGTAEARYEAEGPWLVALPVSSPEAAVFEELAQFAALPHALLLVSSPLPHLRLTLHLQSWLNAVTQDEDTEIELLMRYFDGQTGMAMVDLWPQAERDAFAGAFFWWCGWNVRFGLRMQKGRREPRAAVRSTPLAISEGLLEKIDGLNRVERMVALTVEQDAEQGELDGTAPWLRNVIAHQALAQAHALGIAGWADERIAVALALRVHSEIFEQPYMPELIARSPYIGGLSTVIAGIPGGALEKQHDIHAAAALQRTARRVLAEVAGRAKGNI